MDDFVKYFGRVQICQIQDDYIFHSELHEGDFKIWEFDLEAPGSYTFSISQKGARMFPKNAGYEYSNTRMILV